MYMIFYCIVSALCIEVHFTISPKKLPFFFFVFLKSGIFCSAIESAGGFLAEWWSIFYDMFASRQEVGDQGTSQQQDKGEGSGLVTI